MVYRRFGAEPPSNDSDNTSITEKQAAAPSVAPEPVCPVVLNLDRETYKQLQRLARWHALECRRLRQPYPEPVSVESYIWWLCQQDKDAVNREIARRRA